MNAGTSDSTPHPSQGSTAKQQQPQKASALPSPQHPAADKHHSKPPTGLKRGFLSGKTYRPTAKSLQAVSASSAGQGVSQAAESQLQHGSTYQSSQPAFTGSVVERPALLKDSQNLDEPPMQAQQSSSDNSDVSRAGLMAASSSGQPAEEAAPRRVSKFKQSRNVS